MSEVLRTFEPGPGVQKRRYSGSRARTRRRAWRSVAWFVILATGAFFWFTRDSVPLATFVPKDIAYQIVFPRPFAETGVLSDSPLWSLLPEKWSFPAQVKGLGDNVDMPDWLFQNLAGNLCHISGNDMAHFSDAIVICEMTRVGKLVEGAHWFFPKVIANDVAGGLRLRDVLNGTLYYTVRGRLLLMSTSRDALIHRLILRPAERISAEQTNELLKDTGASSLRGLITPRSADTASTVLNWAGFAGVADKQGAHFKFRITLAPPTYERYAELLEGASPAPLMLPPEAILEVSANFNKPLGTVLQIVRNLWTHQTAGNVGSPENPNGLPDITKQLEPFLQMLGPGFRIGWYGIDLNEMFPVPEIAGYFDADPIALEGLFQMIPPLPPNAHPWDPILQYDKDTRRARLPLIGGPSLEPTFVIHGNGLVASTSAPLADRLLALPASQNEPSKSGNLFIRLRPKACYNTLIPVGELLAEQGLLKNVTTESFRDIAEKWKKKTDPVEEIALMLQVDGTTITGDLTATFVQTSSKQASEKTGT